MICSPPRATREPAEQALKGEFAMGDESLPQATRDALAKPFRRRQWDGIAAIIAVLVGLLALCVSAYTAWLQREQVRAQVWPYLLLMNYDNERSLSVLNKGVGPAIIRGAIVRVDGKPQPDWSHVLDALGIARPRGFALSTISVNVLSAGEHTAILSFDAETVYKAFRTAATTRMRMELCYCSTLGECWNYTDSVFGDAPSVAPLAQCAVAAQDAFHD